MNTAGSATGLGWPESASPDVSRETSTAPATGLGWPETGAEPVSDSVTPAGTSTELTSENVSRETSDEDAS
jgi:hypothetical protein